ncbi:TetR/AcrR family transcriptional regulator [Spirosoma foliorum]|uniref:TetR/AcrR family transcriptional regulator n=1 Tax=Spirosoma foliorum TaxID=2710596 RepID=A0A7G5GUA6_9BACT|nr:TetR/AcrR family transcriptional regulator [Spirosoma foliorum]QMW02448.1 TetR/AcrR family transcriptional regulator [Spirosoma foliorum]
MKSASSTEDKIKEAAKKVFLEKGFEGATTRDIAKEADLNCALMNYYFRSKEKLFAAVFDEMLQLFFAGMTNVLTKPISLKEKIIELIEHDFQTFKQNPSLCIFILNELHRDPDHLVNIIQAAKTQATLLFEKQLREAIDQGMVRPVNPHHVLSLLLSNTQFIFLGKAITMNTWQMSENAFTLYAEEHKQLVTLMIINFLFIEKSEDKLNLHVSEPALLALA